MPVFTPTISQQQTGISGGKATYPQISQAKFGGIISDEFFRETLNPSGSFAIYTTSVGAGAGTNTITNGSELQLLTTNSINDNNCVRTSGLSINRYPLAGPTLDQRSSYSLDVYFHTVLSNTNLKFWVGLYNNFTTTTTIPSEATARLAGIYLDTSVSPNIKFRQGNVAGNADSDTDTNVALQKSTQYRINITQNGNNSGTMSLYSSSNNFTNLLSSVIISHMDYLGGPYGYELFFFLQTLDTNAKDLRINAWQVSFS